MSNSEAVTDPTVTQVRHIVEGVEIDLLLPDDLFYFDGHFPGHPILPGVVQVDWAVRFADHYLDMKIGSAQSFSVKFSSIIQPRQPITMVLQRSTNDERLRFIFRDNGKTLSTGSIRLASHS